jgi:hypothetical protein
VETRSGLYIVRIEAVDDEDGAAMTQFLTRNERIMLQWNLSYAKS